MNKHDMTDEEYIEYLEGKVESLEETIQALNENHHDDLHGDDDYYDSQMSHSQQCYADRSSYANELLRAGKISEEQADEMRMGA